MCVIQQLGVNYYTYSVCASGVNKSFKANVLEIDIIKSAVTKQRVAFTNLFPYVRWTRALCGMLPLQWLQEAPEGRVIHLWYTDINNDISSCRSIDTDSYQCRNVMKKQEEVKVRKRNKNEKYLKKRFKRRCKKGAQLCKMRMRRTRFYLLTQ